MAGTLTTDRLVFEPGDMADSSSVGSYLLDSAGNLITSQANGSQQALDVGINVAGVQIDPRNIRALTAADIVTVDQGTSPWVVSGTVAATQSGSWTVTSNQGTSPWVTSDLADGSVNGGAAGTKSLLGGGIYNSSPLTLTNGQQASLQLDASGYLKVDLATPVNVQVISEPPDTAVNQQNVAVTTTAAKLLTSELASRKNMFVQNLGNKSIYIGKDASVTSSNGFQIVPQGILSIDLGPDVSLYAVAASGSQDTRVLQFS